MAPLIQNEIKKVNTIVKIPSSPRLFPLSCCLIGNLYSLQVVRVPTSPLCTFHSTSYPSFRATIFGPLVKLKLPRIYCNCSSISCFMEDTRRLLFFTHTFNTSRFHCMPLSVNFSEKAGCLPLYILIAQYVTTISLSECWEPLI